MILKSRVKALDNLSINKENQKPKAVVPIFKLLWTLDI